MKYLVLFFPLQTMSITVLLLDNRLRSVVISTLLIIFYYFNECIEFSRRVRQQLQLYYYEQCRLPFVGRLRETYNHRNSYKMLLNM